ncbi:hypothetical protein [Dictyobacter aurantiacus]|uniref:Uncharacterized protein n=1 Tax=Dictyobacter aurantiacus TaxID=1936993 RepID=A0A401ZH45_9CHLR|nr:hypothetical protein [Dictyobacter aurantiacus]GCE06187.1 hypothetical protein KDAU_35160 [Dictyobacter aurantiacus]
MQQSLKSQKPGGGNSQVQTIMITAITLFALSGAILGFAVGAFTHPRTVQQIINTSGGDKKTTPVVVAKTPSPITTAVTTQAIPQGCPGIGTTYGIDGTITLTLAAKQKVQGSCNPVNEPDLTSNGITCRIFLAKAKGVAPEIDGTDIALFKDTNNYGGTFPHEINPGLVVVNGGSLTQPCMQGKATWTLKLADTLNKGKYYIVGLTGNSPFYNYSWSTQLNVTGQK